MRTRRRTSQETGTARIHRDTVFSLCYSYKSLIHNQHIRWSRLASMVEAKIAAQYLFDTATEVKYKQKCTCWYWYQCCGFVTIFFGSGSHFPPSFGSGYEKNSYKSGSGSYFVKSFGSSFRSDPEHSLFHNANDFKWLLYIWKQIFQRKC
jgi:hypothetical protein